MSGEQSSSALFVSYTARLHGTPDHSRPKRLPLLLIYRNVHALRELPVLAEAIEIHVSTFESLSVTLRPHDPIGHYVVVARCHDIQLDRNHVFRLSPSLAEKLSKGTWPLVLAAKHAPTRDVVLKIVRDECLDFVEVAFIERSDDSGEFHHVRMRLSHNVLLKEAHLRSWTACGACSGRITRPFTCGRVSECEPARQVKCPRQLDPPRAPRKVTLVLAPDALQVRAEVGDDDCGQGDCPILV